MRHLSFKIFVILMMLGLLGGYGTAYYPMDNYDYEQYIETLDETDLTEEDFEQIREINGFEDVNTVEDIKEKIEEKQLEEEPIEEVQDDRILDTKDYEELTGTYKQYMVRIVSDNEIETLGTYIIVDGWVYTNPEHNPNIDVYELGYRHLFIDDMIEFDYEQEKIVRYYYDDGELIHRAWRVEPLTEEEKAERTIEQGE